jgi:hypothetical protein
MMRLRKIEPAQIAEAIPIVRAWLLRRFGANSFVGNERITLCEDQRKNEGRRRSYA